MFSPEKQFNKIPEAQPEQSVAEQIGAAIEQLGKENVLGPREVEHTFGVHLSEVPRIPFSVEDMEVAKKLGQMLVLRVDKTADGKPMSLEAMNALVVDKWHNAGKSGLLWTLDGWREELSHEYYANESPRFGWALVSKSVLPESVNKNYVEQTVAIIDILTREVFRDREIPEQYIKAIAEFESKKELFVRLMEDRPMEGRLVSGDLREAARQLSALAITQLTRRTAPETIYDLALYYDNNGKRLFEGEIEEVDKMRTWSSSLDPDDSLVAFGLFGIQGVSGGGLNPNFYHDNLGADFSRRS